MAETRGGLEFRRGERERCGDCGVRGRREATEQQQKPGVLGPQLSGRSWEQWVVVVQKERGGRWPTEEEE